jgi:solute carrier family 25, member 39/40
MVAPGNGGITMSTSEAAAAAREGLDPSCAVEETQRRTFTSTLDGLKKISRNEGLRSLWRGLTPTLAMAVPGNVIYFAGYDHLRHNQKSPLYNLPDTYSPLIAGGLARVGAASAISPVEMFRTRLQATNTQKSGGHFMDTMRDMGEMVKSKGVTTLWRGLGLTLWRDVPFSGIYWWGYETIKIELVTLREQRRGRSDIRDSSIEGRRRARSKSKEHSHAATFTDSFIAGAVSGALSALITTPFDVGKTRQQVLQYNSDPFCTDAQGKQVLRPENRSMPRFLMHIYREEGMSGIFKGWSARCLKVAPACAIMISSYEVGKKMALRANEKSRADKYN